MILIILQKHSYFVKKKQHIYKTKNIDLVDHKIWKYNTYRISTNYCKGMWHSGAGCIYNPKYANWKLHHIFNCFSIISIHLIATRDASFIQFVKSITYKKSNYVKNLVRKNLWNTVNSHWPNQFQFSTGLGIQNQIVFIK